MLGYGTPDKVTTTVKTRPSSTLFLLFLWWIVCGTAGEPSREGRESIRKSCWIHRHDATKRAGLGEARAGPHHFYGVWNMEVFLSIFWLANSDNVQRKGGEG